MSVILEGFLWTYQKRGPFFLMKLLRYWNVRLDVICNQLICNQLDSGGGNPGVEIDLYTWTQS